MKAYMIVRAEIFDREQFVSGYGKEAGKLVKKFGGRYLVKVPNAIALEGINAENNSVVISEWDSKESCLEFWNSEEYQEVKTMRNGIANCDVIIIESDSLT